MDSEHGEFPFCGCRYSDHLEHHLEKLVDEHHSRIFRSPLQTTIDAMPDGRVMMEFRSIPDNELLFCVHLQAHVALAHADALIQAADEVNAKRN